MRNLVIAATILAPATALAGGYVIPNENARDLGLAQATVADQTGAEAIFLNPAALAGQQGFDISAGDNLLVNRTTWTDGAQNATIIPQTNVPPTGAIGYGARFSNGMALGIGVGFGVPGGGSLKYPNGWAGQEYIQSVDQKVYEINAGIGIQIVPGLKVGVAYVRYQGTEELHQSVNFEDHYGDGHLGLNGGTNAIEVAGEIKIPKTPITLGATFKTSGNTTLKGDVHFTGVPAQFTTLLHDQSVSEKLTVPSELVVGAAVRITRGLTAMASFTDEFWSVYHNDTYVGGDGFTVTVPRNYKNAQVYRLGAEWRMPFFHPITIRAGGIRSISEQPSDTVSPTLTDGDSWSMSAGLGVNICHDLRVDFGWQKSYFDNVTASGTEALPGTYRTIVTIYSLGANWRFGGPAHHKHHHDHEGEPQVAADE